MKLIKVTAAWCMSCIIMKSRVEALEKKFNDDVDIIELDADENLDEIKKLNIGEKLPVYIIMNDDVEVSRLIGEKSSKDLDKFFSEGGLY